MGMAIGTRNRSLEAPPAWATPEWSDHGDFFSLYENCHGEQWAFLQRGDALFLSGSDIGWKTRKKDTTILGNLTAGAVIDLIATAGERFGLVMSLPERMWLAACILEVSKRRELKSSAPAPIRP